MALLDFRWKPGKGLGQENKFQNNRPEIMEEKRKRGSVPSGKWENEFQNIAEHLLWANGVLPQYLQQLYEKGTIIIIPIFQIRKGDPKRLANLPKTTKS